jgi:hypothetical protein
MPLEIRGGVEEGREIDRERVEEWVEDLFNGATNNTDIGAELSEKEARLRESIERSGKHVMDPNRTIKATVIREVTDVLLRSRIPRWQQDHSSQEGTWWNDADFQSRTTTFIADSLSRKLKGFGGRIEFTERGQDN